MIRPILGAAAFGLLATSSAFAIAPNCADQLAQIKAEVTSDVLAQSALGKKYQEATRLCEAGNDMQAQALAREIREGMADKNAGSSAQESAGSSANGPSKAPKGSQVMCPDGKPAIVAAGAYRCPRSE
jgi:hypothetical protein